MTNPTEAKAVPAAQRDEDAAAPAPQRLAGLDSTEAYTTDILDRRHVIPGILAAGFGAALFVLACWIVLKHTHMPAFGSSNLSRAISTAGTAAVLLAVGGLVWWWLRDEHSGSIGHPVARPKWRTWLTYLVCYLSPAALVVTNLGIPLASTKLYLDGINYDQRFRTQFFTRMTDGINLHDMAYIGMPSYYPAGWFFTGGRFANLMGLPGWEAFQPWALITIGAAAAVLVPVWQHICGSLPVATGIALVSVCAIMVISPEEPYAAIVALGAPAATVLGRRALDGSRLAMAGVTIYLGLSATMYTLYTATVALSVVVVAAVLSGVVYRTWQPIGRLVLIGLGSMLIALSVWGPFLWEVLVQGKPQSGATAPHYLPFEGSQVPVPMFSFSIIGVLCLMGLVFLVVRAVDQDIRAMGVALAVFYGWIVASMVVTLAGDTLLGFRLDALVTLQMATAGVLALADLRLVGVSRILQPQLGPKVHRNITFIMVLVLALAGLSYAQSIPQRAFHSIDLAYTDTDGNGYRADRFPSDSGRYFEEINGTIRERGYQPNDTVVLTDNQNFMAYFPYHGFQAFTSHYANPLGQFDKRNEAIEDLAQASWKDASTPDAFAAKLDSLPWRGPDVFLIRGSVQDESQGWKYDVAEDIYPNNPNVRYKAVQFNPKVFTGNKDLWTVKQVGPYALVVRNR